MERAHHDCLHGGPGLCCQMLLQGSRANGGANGGNADMYVERGD